MPRPSNPNNPAYYAKKYMYRFVQTCSLSKLEKFVKDNQLDRGKEAIACYVYYAAKDKINKLSHPHLTNEVNNFEKYKDDESSKFNKYHIAEASVKLRGNWTSQIDDSKRIIRNDILEKMNENNISVSVISKFIGIPQSNLYRYLTKGEYKYVSIDLARSVRDFLDKEFSNETQERNVN